MADLPHDPIAEAIRAHNVPPMFSTVDEIRDHLKAQCEIAGHDWAPAGGGLLVCMRCEAERWED